MRHFVLSVAALAAIVLGACTTDPESTADKQSGHQRADDGKRRDAGDGSSPEEEEKLSISTEYIDLEGTSREYVLAAPRTIVQGKTYPLVLVFHGDGGTGPGMQSSHRFEAFSGEEAIVAYPTGIGFGWDMQTPSATNGDIKFVEEIVAELSDRFPIDSSRVFGTGYSSGAFFINKIACRKTGFFRAIVSHAGGAPYEEQDPAASKWPNDFTKCAGQTGGVAAMVLHGQNDGVVTPDSGEFSAMYWASLNGCGDTRSSTEPSPCVKYDGCPSESPVLWCLIPDLSHLVWSDGAKVGWDFMRSLP